MKTVGVNWAPVRIRYSGRVGDSGHDTFEKKKLVLHLVVSEHSGFDSDPPIGSDREGVLHQKGNVATSELIYNTAF